MLSNDKYLRNKNAQSMHIKYLPPPADLAQLAMFCIASINAVAMLLEALIRSTRLVPSGASDHITHVPLCGPSHTLFLACLPVAACISFVWLVRRDSDFAWVLQDLQVSLRVHYYIACLPLAV